MKVEVKDKCQTNVALFFSFNLLQNQDAASNGRVLEQNEP